MRKNVLAICALFLAVTIYSAPLDRSETTDFLNKTSVSSQSEYNLSKQKTEDHRYVSNPTAHGLLNLTNSSISDSLALVALYNQCNGPNWTKKDNWLTGALHTWQGVNLENGRVVGLDLGDMVTSLGLTGQLPAELANLKEIRSLSFSNNKLTGNLPENWSALVQLQNLYLKENQLSGELPVSWSSLKQLKVLDLGMNQLSGNLPEEWAALDQIQVLALTRNQLTGILPSSWSALKKMEALQLGENQFTGTLPPDWATLVDLIILELDWNQLSGTLPENWSAMRNLRVFWLFGNQITGTLPEGWSALVNLQRLHLNFNKLTGDLPDSWSALVKLTELHLWQNKFTGSLPASWASLVKLQKFWVNENQLSGTFPVSWSSLVNLNDLNISYNQISGLPELSTFSKLNELSVQNNLLDFGDIEPNIGISQNTFSYSPQGLIGDSETVTLSIGKEFRTLVVVGGSSNKYQWYKDGMMISGAAGPEYVIPSLTFGDAGIYTCQITNTKATQLTLKSNPITLKVLNQTSSLNTDSLSLVALYNQCNGPNWTKKNNWLTGPLNTWQGVTLVNGRVIALYLEDSENSVGLTGQLPTELSNLTEIQSINLGWNNLSGPLPNWSALVNLRSVWLNNNQFTGNLPGTWKTLVNLTDMNLIHNQLTGSLPVSWSALVNLQNLQLDENKFTGSLPIEWSALVNIYHIGLSGNQLTGSLPESWSVLVKLTSLYFSQNDLTGIIPDSWAKLINLQILHLEHNRLNGNLPESWKALTNLQFLNIADNQISGLPKLSTLTKLNDFLAGNNSLDFGDIEPNMGIPKNLFIYSPQGLVGKPKTVFLKVGEEFIISVAVGGSSNKYQWYKNGIAIPAASGSEYVIPSVSMNDFGIYSCNITNAIATELTLQSSPINLLEGSSQFANSDSLALVALYNQCNGPNWTQKDNWLAGPLKTWQGVTVVNGRVVALDLDDFSNPVGLTGQLPDELASLTEIRSLNLSNNKLTGNLPDGWSALVNLDLLGLSNNLFTGNLPDSWVSLVNLREMLLAYNQLDGALPASWSALTNLQNLQLLMNNFSGPLPDSWSNLVNLSQLLLSYNQLTGSLPDSWSSLVKLDSFWLNDNKFTGALPVSWGALVNLIQLLLSNNQLTELPELSVLTSLNTFKVENNLLDFGDIEPNIGVSLNNFIYSPQGLVGKTETIIKSPGSEFKISVTVGGQSNKYQWYKNGSAIPGAIGTEYIISSVDAADAGIYTCQITNTIATQLTLTSNPVTLQITNQVFANAGTDQSVNEGEMITLDGSASSDPDGNPITYKWTAPAGITLSSATTAKPTFTAPEVSTNTDYTFSLVVNNGTMDSPADQVVVTVKNISKAPVAHAGADQSVDEEVLVSLDGSASSDPDGNPITYKWTVPAGITLSSATTAKPTFTAPEVSSSTDYTFTLVVNNGSMDSPADQVVVTVKNISKSPVAHAGTDQSVQKRTTVFLDGTASSSVDGNPITYKWTAPEGILLSSITASNPSFAAPEVSANTDYTFTLVVNDGTMDSPADQVVITVMNVNELPVALAGPEQYVDERMSVSLNGSASFDPEGNPITYKWTAPAGITLSSTTSQNPTFTSPEVTHITQYVFNLVVNNGHVNSLPSIVKIIVLSAIKIYPNPTLGILNIEMTQGKDKKTEVVVMSLVGDEIFRKEFNDASKFRIDLSDQIRGFYLLEIFNNNKQYNSIIIIQEE